MSVNDERPADGGQVERAQGETTLIEVEPGIAVLFGESVPEGWDVEPFVIGERGRAEIANTLGLAVAGANVAASGAMGLVSAQGLVRLAPETLKHLKTMDTVVKDGYHLGTLMQGGKFAAQVRWAPAVGAQAATVLESLGPSLTLLAISAQLTMISGKIDENTELTRDVLEMLHKDHVDTLRGLHETVVGAVDEARAVGAVTPRIFDRVKPLESSIRAERTTFSDRVDEHLSVLDSGYSERRDYLRDHVPTIVGDVQGLMMAESAYCGYEMLRAAEIANDESRSPDDEKLMRRLAQQVPEQRRRSLERVDTILRELDVQCHLATQLSGRAWNPRDLVSRRSAGVDQTVGAMTRHVAWLRGEAYEEPAALEPPLKLRKKDTEDDVLNILRWLLPAEEPLLALAEGTILGRLGGTAGYLGVTTMRMFLSSQADLTGEGILKHRVPLTDLRYVRLKEEGRGAVLNVITKDQDLTVRFDSWVLTQDRSAELQRLADLLMTAVNLPEEERRSEPLLTEVTSRRQLLDRASFSSRREPVAEGADSGTH